jgi:hypothetical protein
VSADIMRYFDASHLDGERKEVSSIVGNLAGYMDEHLPEGDQKDIGLQKLLEAKDCFVRAVL